MFPCERCDKKAARLFRCDDHYRCDDCGTSEGLFARVDELTCSPCHEIRVAARVKAYQESDNCLYESNFEITCPHCGKEESDSWDRSAYDGKDECSYCGREFTWTRHIEVTYESWPVPTVGPS